VDTPASEVPNRRRWSWAYGILLSIVLGGGVLLVMHLIPMTGRGSQVGEFVRIVFAIPPILIAFMAAESLAWRLRESTRRLLFAVTLVFGFAGLALIASEVLELYEAQPGRIP
jgi:hypothetical protein